MTTNTTPEGDAVTTFDRHLDVIEQAAREAREAMADEHEAGVRSSVWKLWLEASALQALVAGW